LAALESPYIIVCALTISSSGKFQSLVQSINTMPVDTCTLSVTVTVTEALVLRPLLEARVRITESIRILMPVDRMKQKCFHITTKRVRRSQQFQLHE